MSKQKVSAIDILSYFENVDNHFEILQAMINEVDKSPYFKLRYYIEKYIFRFKHIEGQFNTLNGVEKNECKKETT